MKHRVSEELKYAELNRLRKLEAAKEIFDLFKKTKRTIFFRACVLPYSSTGLENVPGASLNQKRVRIYGHSAKILVLSHLPRNKEAILYMDKEDRIERTKFKSKVCKAKATKGGKIKSVISVDSKNESTPLIQLCDLLTGVILQELYPTNTKKGRFKRQWKEYVSKKLGIVIKGNARKVKNKDGKFSVSFQKMPNLYLIPKIMKRKQKSRS